MHTVHILVLQLGQHFSVKMEKYLRDVFRTIAIVGAKKELEYPKEYCYPCGVCRQVMTEFCDDSFEIISAINESDYEIHTLDEIMPFAFKL